MRKKWLFLLFILFFTALLRFYKISSIPPSLNWDEVAIGWNAKTIFHTRRDEYGIRLPLTFKSFGDYKAPVYIYLTAPIVGIFGMNEFSVRLLSVLAGIGNAVILYFLVKELTRKVISYQLSVISYWPILSAILLATCPWHILLSRFASEQNLATFFILAGTWLFLLGINKKSFYFLPSAFSFTLSLYTYHSPKIFVPIFLLGLAFIFRKKLFNKENFIWVLASITLAVIILLPLGKSMIFGASGERFKGTSIFYTKEGEKKTFNLKLISELGKNYLIHYSPKFLFLGADKNPRIQMRKIGPLLLIEAPFLLLGLFALIKQKKEKWAQFLLWWFLVGPVPATIGFEAPHPIRAFNLLPALVIITAVGVIEFMKSLKVVRKNLRWKTVFLMGLVFLINIIYFLYRYFVFYPIYSAPDWQYGYKEAIKLAQSYENEVEKIIMTSSYGQPYVFTLFYQNRNPQQAFWGAMSKYLYRDIKWDEDPNLENVLLIGTPEEIPEDAKGKITEIKFPDGNVAFRVVKTN